MWWALITMSSVGYGDIYPTSTVGRILASITVVLGVMILSLPVSILVQNFTEHADDEEQAGLLSTMAPRTPQTPGSPARMSLKRSADTSGNVRH